jgi:hypothetical protein
VRRRFGARTNGGARYQRLAYTRRTVRASIQEALVSVWRQVLVENSAIAIVENRKYRVKKTSKFGLRQVDFMCEGEEIRGLEQNPDSKSRWGRMARDGEVVMQFLFGGNYIANVADGIFTAYSGTNTASTSAHDSER